MSTWMVAAGGALLFFAVMFLSFATLVLKAVSSLTRQLSELRDLSDAVAKQSVLLQSIADNTHISDAAKSLAHRQQELDALRTAIREENRNEHWEESLVLIDEMERRFGGKDEADRLREELDDARAEELENRLREAIDLVESHFQSQAWDRAEGEIERLRQALPDHTKVLALTDRMNTLRVEHKKKLLQEWDEAVRRSDTDHAIDILKELDQYLTTSEAKALQSSARHVFKDKLLQVGVQFRFAVMEKRWPDALQTGLELIRDFPNARMAGEVREALDTLRERARVSAES